MSSRPRRSPWSWLTGSFRAKVVWRLAFILATMAGTILLVAFTDQYMTAVVLLLVLFAQVAGLVNLVEVTNQKLQLFLESIRYSDFSASFSYDNRLGTSFRLLNEQFNAVIADFKRTRAEKEENLRYLDTVVQHVGTGLMTFDASGQLHLINNAAKQLLQYAVFRNIDELEAVSPALVLALRTLSTGNSTLVRLRHGPQERQLSVRATEFRMRGKAYKLVSLQDIQLELEQKELEAWRNLARVLRHEIMNSITPISSLSGTIRQMVADEARPADPPRLGQVLLDAEAFSDLQEGLATIEKRSQGLVHFVDAYRNFTAIPVPALQTVAVAPLFQQIELLMREELQQRGVYLHTSVQPPSLHVVMDPDLIEMVLINLVKNAAEAYAEARATAEAGPMPASPPEIRLTAALVEGNAVIQVSDHGPGIIPEALDKIFIPFYSTKRGGSGIGLAWSRQIMHQHRGTLTVHSVPDQHTTFSLRFA